MNFWFRDEIRIDPVASDSDVDGRKTYTAGTVTRGRVEDVLTVLRLPDGTEKKSTTRILTRQRCPEDARVFPAPLPASGDGGRAFPASYAFAETQCRTPILVKGAHMPGVGHITEIYF